MQRRQLFKSVLAVPVLMFLPASGAISPMQHSEWVWTDFVMVPSPTQYSGHFVGCWKRMYYGRELSVPCVGSFTDLCRQAEPAQIVVLLTALKTNGRMAADDLIDSMG